MTVQLYSDLRIYSQDYKTGEIPAASTDGWASSERGCCREGRARVTFMAFGGDIRYGRRSLLLSPRTELVVKPEMIGLDQDNAEWQRGKVKKFREY